MSLLIPKFKIHKKVLPNGLTILAKPTHHIPRVEAHLWYNIGSKNEGHRERGMAHLIEHMLFKGTKNLSESDINLICQKLTGDANAFTSQDYTCYTFRLPSDVWHIALEVFAECMQHARFDSQMLASELKAVIEELRMYKEDFQGSLLENMIASMFPQHPYQNPIIGSKFDLCDLERDTLYAFYKKHYHPKNAVLVVTGDVKPEAVFQTAEKLFGHIPSPADYVQDTFHIQEDLVSKSTTLFRPTNAPWYCYAYKIPGLQSGQNHLVDLASLVLATSKSSRLYLRLVNKEKVALDVDCSVYDFFQQGFLCIGVWPVEGKTAAEIETILYEEFTLLSKKIISDWEFEAAKKRTLVDFSSLLESAEKQAFVIGNSYLATQDKNFIEKYMTAIMQTTKQELQNFFAQTFNFSQQHKGYLLPIEKKDLKQLTAYQSESEQVEHAILLNHKRTSPVEPGNWVNRIKKPEPTSFTYPKPKNFILKNGLDVVYHHNPTVPQVVCIIGFKANFLYEPEDLGGSLGLLLRTMTDATKDLTDHEFAKYLETEGIYLTAGSDSIMFRCLSQDLEKGLKILSDIIKDPVLRPGLVDKNKQQLLSELDEFWDCPSDYIDQYAKEIIYQDHPYHKHPQGDKKSIQKLTKKDLLHIFKTLISPDQATMVIVGDLSDPSFPALIEKYFASWTGPKIPNLIYPAMPIHMPQELRMPLNRDQVTLAFAAPSISRKDPNYNALALLDIIVTGGAHASPSSRLFQLREKSGLFYTIGGSLIYGSRDEPGMSFIKTIVASGKTETAKKLILETLDLVGKKGITQDELDMARNLLLASSVELFESNMQMAQTFLFLKNLNLSFNLFDKQGEILSILKLDQVNEIAKRYCNKKLMSVIQIGRIKK